MAVIIVLRGGGPLQADDAKTAEAIEKELKAVEKQFRQQLTDLYGTGSPQVKRFDSELRKMRGGKAPERAVGKAALYANLVNQALEDLYGATTYAVRTPGRQPLLSEIDGKIMTQLLQRLEDIEKVLRMDWRHTPRKE
jgi:hypothetical protein